MTLQCACIDDEPLARECIENYVREIDFLQLVGTGNNPVDLTQLMDQQKIDLVFLDIQMPIMNGIDFLKLTPNPPLVIITTAYPSYALESFQLDVIDYLLKPITFNRFFKAVNKAKDYHQLLQGAKSNPSSPPTQEDDYFFIKCENKYEKLYFDELLFVQAMQNYVTIHTTNGKYLTLLYLKNVAQYLDPKRFLRVHKSYIVSISRIDAIDHHELVISDFRIPISRNYREEVMNRVVNDRLWKK